MLMVHLSSLYIYRYIEVYGADRMSYVTELFKNPDIDTTRLEEIEMLPDPKDRYIIAMTPRSGSSYLCDVLTKCNQFGSPIEVMNQNFIPRIMQKIPGRTPDEYIRNVTRVRKSRNQVAGFKASWFQFKNFYDEVARPEFLTGFKYIYLTRRDLAAQAVSLYKATASTVFHTNIQHDDDAIRTLESMEYDYDSIDNWYRHIYQQEKGWNAFFYENNITPLCISYEDVEEDVLDVLRRIARFVGIEANELSMPEAPSVFKKIRDQRNIEWAHRYAIERGQV